MVISFQTNKLNRDVSFSSLSNDSFVLLCFVGNDQQILFQRVFHNFSFPFSLHHSVLTARTLLNELALLKLKQNL